MLPSKTVWDLVSDLDAEPKYWKGTKSVKTISRNGNTVQREVIIAFRDKKCEQTVQIVPEESILRIICSLFCTVIVFVPSMIPAVN